MSSQRYRGNAQRWGESMLRAMDDQLLRCIATISSGRYAGWSGRPSREHRAAAALTEPLWLLAEVIWREVARNRCTTR